MLVRGTYRQIAHAAWKNSSVQKDITQLMRKDIETEAMEKASEEINSKSRAKQECTTHLGAVAMAATVCLRNRSKYMIAAQLLLTIFLYHSNWLVRVLTFYNH